MTTEQHNWNVEELTWGATHFCNVFKSVEPLDKRKRAGRTIWIVRVVGISRICIHTEPLAEQDDAIIVLLCAKDDPYQIVGMSVATRTIHDFRETHVNLSVGLRGLGLGVVLYSTLFDYAMTRGIELRSTPDKLRKPPADWLWESTRLRSRFHIARGTERYHLMGRKRSLAPSVPSELETRTDPVKVH